MTVCPMLSSTEVTRLEFELFLALALKFSLEGSEPLFSPRSLCLGTTRDTLFSFGLVSPRCCRLIDFGSPFGL